MNTWRTWMAVVLGPLLLTIAVDQMTKAWAVAHSPAFSIGPLQLLVQANAGFMLGSLSNASTLYTVVVPSTLAAFLFFSFLVIQYFTPLISPYFRVGLSVFTGGALSNFIDRALVGRVIDFIHLDLGFVHTGVFNVADALQWVGVIIFLSSYIANGQLLFPANQRRGRKWVDPPFQRRYCFALLGTGGAFAVIAGVLSFTFLRFATMSVQGQVLSDVERLLATYMQVYAAATACFLIGVFVIGVHLSHRIVGPVRAFEGFLEDLISGRGRQLKLRQHDEWRQLEQLADRFYENFHQSLNIDLPPIEAGAMAPETVAKTFDGATVRLSDMAGKRVWIIFYRYATCPLCAVHLDDIRATIERVKADGGDVWAVYEAVPDALESQGCARTMELLRSVGIRLLVDSDRQLYRAYRTRTRLLPLLNPRILVRLIQARLRGFKQGKILGNLGQLPAHFLIDEQGRLAHVFYGDDFSSHVESKIVESFFSGPRPP